jgi:hypothetical protein
MANCYSLQIEKVADLSVLAAINKKLVVEPEIMMPNTVFVNPTDQKVQEERVNDGQLENTMVDAPVNVLVNVSVSAPINVSVNEAPSEKVTAIADSSPNTAPPKMAVPAKSKPKKSSTNVAIKKGRNASVKKLTVDLKSKLKSDIFSADEADNVSNSASESDSAKVKDLKVANQSFVTFSSGDDEQIEPALEDVMQIDKTSTVVSMLPNEPAGLRMKAIKVPKTFMENGYLVTEMITEMVPVDENSSSQEQQTSDPVMKNPAMKDPAVKNPVANKFTGKKQGSLLSFFKPK